VVNRPNRQLWIKVVDQELESFDRARTWDVVDKVERGKNVGNMWVVKVKGLADKCINKFKA
jgi:hypothetical protein